MNEKEPSEQRRPWDTDGQWKQLRERIAAAESLAPREPAPGHARFTRLWRHVVTGIAAVLLAVVATSVLRRERHPSARIVSTAAGEHATVHLSDSSVVTLGPASSIQYLFTDTSRVVDVTGLANFQVRHDAHRPFVTRSRNAQAVDIGTEFVVRAYPEDSAIVVSVTSGRIALRTNGSRAAGRELAAGTAAHVGRDGTVVLDSGADAILNSAWVDGRLVFRDQSVAQVAIDVGRTFDVDIRIADSSLARRRVSAIYSNASLAGVLEALMATIDARYERTGRTITISPSRP